MKHANQSCIGNYIRSLDDKDLIVFLKEMIYEEGYVNGYNGNDEDEKFNRLIEELIVKIKGESNICKYLKVMLVSWFVMIDFHVDTIEIGRG